MTENKIDLRKNFLINQKFQFFLLKLILGSCLLCIVALLMSSAAFYFMLNRFYFGSLDNNFLTTLNTIDDTAWVYFSMVAVGLIFSFVVIGYSWLKISHRLAGPLYRIQTNLEKYIQGQNFEEIKLRENDQFKDLAELINQALQKARKNS